MKTGNLLPQEPPNPKIKNALVYVPDLQQSIARMENCWSIVQFEDAIRSTESFLYEIKRLLKTTELPGCNNQK